MKLHTYVNEVFDIAKEHDMSWDIGADMFLANIRNAGEEGRPYYPGAEHMDYAALKEHHDELASSMGDFVEAVRKYIEEIAILRRKGDREAAVRLISDI